MKINHKAVEYHQHDDGTYYARVTDGDYAGVSFNLGYVRFDESDPDEPKMEYHYTILDGSDLIVDESEFKRALGDYIVEQIEMRLSKGDLIYTGGE